MFLVYRSNSSLFQNFLLSNDIEPEGLDETNDIKLYMVSLYDKSNILMHFSDGNQIKIITTNINLAGSFIQSLAKFMNMENLQVDSINLIEMLLQSVVFYLVPS